MLVATLVSNRGDHRLTLELDSPSTWRGEPGIETVFRLDARHFDSEHDHDLTTRIESLWISVRSLAALHRDLQSWLDLPLAQLRDTELTGTYSLALLPSQRLDLVFGRRDGTISDGHPTLGIECAAGNLEARFHFVTDQSCLRLFDTQLEKAVAGESVTAS